VTSALGLLLGAAVAISAGAHAAAQAHAVTLPKVFSGAFAPGGNQLPLGRSRAFVQFWYRGDDLAPPRAVQRLGWRPDETLSTPVQPQTLEIVLSSTTRGFDSLDVRYASNLGTDATVFAALRGYQLPPLSPPHDPDRPALWMPGDRPFLWSGPHLLVQVDVRTTFLPFPTGYAADGYATALPGDDLHAFSEPSCGGATLRASSDAVSYVLRVRGAPPNQPLTVLLGVENRMLGPLPLPLALDSLGMTGCVLALAPLAALSASSGADGTAVLTLRRPPGQQSVAVHAQAAHGTTRNPAGVAATDCTHSVLGALGLGNYVYSWDSFGPVAEYGPFQTSRGAVLLVE
jgi:hypothetical protein